MAAKALKDKWNEVPEGMKTPLIISAFFHIGLVIVAITGLPYLKSDPKPLMSAISVEILPVAEMATTNRKPVEAPPKPEEEEKTKPKDAKPLPPKVEEVKPPEPPKPKAVEKPKPKAKPVAPPPPDEAALEKVKEAPKPEEKKPPEPEQAEEKAVEPDTSQDFTKLLKNLQDAPQPVEEELPESKEASATPSPNIEQGTQLTEDEYAALQRQLKNCWSIQAGARYAEDIVVELRTTVSPEKRVLSATVVDQWRYGQDSYFRAAADSALRAIHSPQCEILELPAGKYDAWKDMILVFDPKEML